MKTCFYIHPCILIHPQTCNHCHQFAPTLSYSQTCTHTHPQHTYMHRHADIHTYIHTHALTHFSCLSSNFKRQVGSTLDVFTHTHTHTHIHTHIHTYIHTYTYKLNYVVLAYYSMLHKSTRTFAQTHSNAYVPSNIPVLSKESPNTYTHTHIQT